MRLRIKIPKIPQNEDKRRDQLEELDILDTLEEQVYDDLTFLAAQICDTPISLVSLVDKDRQWFKSHYGLDARETPREFAFCAHAILQDDILYVPNSEKDERFCDNPLVQGPPFVKFYAGVPLTINNGYKVGTLCIIDSQPRDLTSNQLKALQSIARQVEFQLELRLKIKKRQRVETENLEKYKIISGQLEHRIMLERTQEAAKIGSWLVDIKSNKCHWSKMTYDIHEVSYGTEILVEDGINYYIEEHKDIIRSCVETAIAKNKNWDVELQINTARGNVKWVRAIGYPVLVDGELIRLEGTFQDITEATNNKTQLALAKEKAEKALASKSNFLTNMSHEIRTPLNGIIGLTSLIRDKKISPEMSEYIENIRNCGESLLYLINDILDLSKIDANKLTIESIPVDIKSLASSTLFSLSPTSQLKGIETRINFSDDMPHYLLGDPLRIRQILYNLIGNAIKFTEKGSVEIKLSTFPKNQPDHFDLQIEIIDTGIGIRNDLQANLFEPFEQMDPSISRKFGGTGLGLAICQKLVHLMNGEIKVRSEVGTGSRFIVKFPTQKVSVAPDNKQPQYSKSNSNKNIKILVVDDNILNQTLTHKFLNKLGYQDIDLVENGSLAVDSALTKNYDLIFMDIQMPHMDGYTATEIIRSKIANKVKIVGLSANAFKEDKEKAFQIGMDEYIEKPMKLEKMKEVIEKLHF